MNTLEIDRPSFISLARSIASPKWLRAVAIFGAIILLSLASLLLARRLSGALEQPLAFGPLAVLLLVLVAAAWAVRIGWRAACPANGGACNRIMLVGPSMALLAVAVALSVDGISPASLVFLWGTVLVSEAGALGASRCYQLLGLRSALHAETSTYAAPIECIAPPRPPGFAANEELELAEGQLLLQQLSRLRDAEGAETIVGKICTPLRAGERTESVHVAFCPPFAVSPEVEFFQVDGPAARVSLGQVQPFGARLELRLEKPSTCGELVTIEIVACGPALVDCPAD